MPQPATVPASDATIPAPDTTFALPDGSAPREHPAC
jgi:hypothetical protein